MVREDTNAGINLLILVNLDCQVKSLQSKPKEEEFPDKQAVRISDWLLSKHLHSSYTSLSGC